MRSSTTYRPRRPSDLRRHRPRMSGHANHSAADEVRTSDLVLAVTGVILLGGLCLVLASAVFAI